MRVAGPARTATVHKLSSMLGSIHQSRQTEEHSLELALMKVATRRAAHGEELTGIVASTCSQQLIRNTGVGMVHCRLRSLRGSIEVRKENMRNQRRERGSPDRRMQARRCREIQHYGSTASIVVMAAAMGNLVTTT
mmetsp:Transcript_30551/g.55801  ORF Transcript_30551/g.55801 Transcript_30551/m.55801 type:complete len:136 (+) Transcript_30551:237-644(+)